MIDLSQLSPSEVNDSVDKTIILEPHVELFKFEPKHASQFLHTIHFLHSFMGFTIMLTIICWFLLGNQFILNWGLWLSVFIVPIYLLVVTLYFQFVFRERNTTLEIDRKNNLIQFKWKRHNILFQRDQVNECEIVANLLLPYQMDYVKITLSGGSIIYVSSLVIDARDLVRYINIPFLVKENWIGFPPKRCQIYD